MDELEGILERQARKLPSGILGHPQCSTLDRSAEADVGMGFRCHEQMFAWPLESRGALEWHGGKSHA